MSYNLQTNNENTPLYMVAMQYYQYFPRVFGLPSYLVHQRTHRVRNWSTLRTYLSVWMRSFYEISKKMSEKLLKEILNIYGYTSARVVIKEDIESEQLIDFINGNKTYAKGITILNKIDLVDEKFLKDVSKKLKTNFIPTSADSNKNINQCILK